MLFKNVIKMEKETKNTVSIDKAITTKQKYAHCR